MQLPNVTCHRQLSNVTPVTHPTGTPWPQTHFCERTTPFPAGFNTARLRSIECCQLEESGPLTGQPLGYHYRSLLLYDLLA